MLIMEVIRKWNDNEVLIYPPTYVHESACIGIGTKIGAFCDIGRDVTIGRMCNIQAHVTIPNGVKIGNGVFIGPNVNIFNDKYINGLLQPPEIGSFTRIGGATIVLPAVKIGNNCLIGAGSIITKDILDGEEVIGKW